MTDDGAGQAADGARRVLLIGIGAGDPGYVTTQAAEAIAAFDVLFIVTKEAEKDDLVDARRAVVERFRGGTPYRTVELRDPERPWKEAPHYTEAVARWRVQRAELWEAAIAEHLGEGETGAFLVWGDPSLYESTVTIIASVLSRGRVAFGYEVLPGISAVHALTARHRIPLNRQGGAVHITPARLLGSGLPAGANDVVVMLDPGTAFTNIDPENILIYWGAYLGTPDEILISGPLGQVGGQIIQAREEAKARKGWIFDTYLLRRVAHERRATEVERRQRQVERQAGEIERRSGIDRRVAGSLVFDLPPMPGGTEAVED